MRRISPLTFCLIVIVLFCSGFFVTSKLTIFCLEKKNTQTFENDPTPYFWIMVFKNGEVQMIHFKEVKDFQQPNSAYSFLVPKGKEDYYNEKLAEAHEKPRFRFEVEHLSDEKQLIKMRSAGSLSDGTDTYEATDKEVFPKTSSEFKMLDALMTFFAGFVGGSVFCIIFLLVYRKLSYRLAV